MAKKKIPLYSLILLIIAAIDSIRNLPSAALFGPALIFFFILAACTFLIPTALVAAELSATYPEKGGVYHWVSNAFGKKWAMVAIWLQWINTMVWYPTILMFIAGTAAYLIDPNLAKSNEFLVSGMLAIFWIITLINLRGLQLSTKISNVCAILGTIIPLTLLISLGAFWFFSNHPLQIELTSKTIIPSFADHKNWVSLVSIMASFLGMELAGVHVNEINNPHRNFPKAVFISSLFILITMLFGSLAIAFVLPDTEISLVSGVMQVFSKFFQAFGIEWLTPFMTLAIVLGTIGGITNWLISPAKGLLHAGEFGFLPNFFRKKNRHDVPANILLTQAVIVTIFSLLFCFQPNINAFYWFFTALSTELYMLMYILMFLSALYLHYNHKARSKVFKIPGGTYGMWITCLLGLFGCITTTIFSFFPPEEIQVKSLTAYLYNICIGNVLALSPLLFFFLYQRRSTPPIKKALNFLLSIVSRRYDR